MNDIAASESIVEIFWCRSYSFECKIGNPYKDRIAIVGRNGTGKSTLLKSIASELGYDSGTLIKPKEVKIGYLDQHTGLNTERTIWDEMLLVFRFAGKWRKKFECLKNSWPMKMFSGIKRNINGS